MRNRLIRVLALCVLVLAATLPFLGKAFHIDDALYLAVARQILAKPWDPFGADVLWEKAPEPLFDADFNPPLWSYLMAGVLAITGEPTVTVQPVGVTEEGTPTFRAESSRAPEVGTHVLESVFVSAAIVATFCLGRRFVRWPLAATALVALSPAILPGQNVMLEGPVMAFWLWGVWCHLRAVETGDMRWTWASGALATLGVLTKYTSVLVVMLLIIYSIGRRQWRSLWFLAAPMAALGLWSLHNWIVYERLHVLVILSRAQTGEHHPVGIQLYESFGRFLATFRALGAVTALALPVGAIIGRRYGTWCVMLIAAASGGLGWAGEWDMTQRLRERGQFLQDAAPAHAIIFGALGDFTLFGLLLVTCLPRRARPSGGDTVASPNGSPSGESGGRHDALLLWIWLGSVLVFGIFATPFLAVRHLLPALPPLVWLVLGRLNDTLGDSRRSVVNWLLGGATLLTAVCGFLVAKADYDFADWMRHMAVDVGSRSVAQGTAIGKSVWFTGHWGWAYYAQRVGMKPFLPGRSELHEGDLLLMPLIQTWDPIPKDLHPYLKGQMQTIKPTPKLPVRTGIGSLDKLLDGCLNSVRSISTEVQFYSGGTLNLPWQFSRKPLDDFAVVGVMSDPGKTLQPRE